MSHRREFVLGSSGAGLVAFGDSVKLINPDFHPGKVNALYEGGSDSPWQEDGAARSRATRRFPTWLLRPSAWSERGAVFAQRTSFLVAVVDTNERRSHHRRRRTGSSRRPRHASAWGRAEAGWHPLRIRTLLEAMQ